MVQKKDSFQFEGAIGGVTGLDWNHYLLELFKTMS